QERQGMNESSSKSFFELIEKNSKPYVILIFLLIFLAIAFIILIKTLSRKSSSRETRLLLEEIDKNDLNKLKVPRPMR
ncbi:MAG: hypothetical protein ACTSVB_01525, partial [Candidatus Heimdallarchaeaceae archaeon]